MLKDSRIKRKQVKEYSRGKDKNGVNLRINLAQQDQLNGWVYIMSEEVFNEYVQKYEDIKKTTQLPTQLDNSTLDKYTGAIDGNFTKLGGILQDLYKKYDSSKQEIIKANKDYAEEKAKTKILEHDLKVKTEQLEQVKELGFWDFITGRHKKFL